MSVYAHVYNNEIIEFKEIDDALYQSWVSSDNPKKDTYRIVLYANQPNVSSTETVDESFTINIDSVQQVWTVRNKTADELRKTWTAYEFLLRFTSAERTAYRAAAQTDDLIADFMSLAQAAQEIISDDPTTIQGMNYLVSVGLLTQQRRDEILS
jgi:hypothetical protein